MMKKLMNYVGALLVLGFSHSILAGDVTATVSDMYLFGTSDAVIGETILTRRKNEVRVDVSTTGLMSYGAYSVWWVAFNNPEFCVNGLLPDRCGLGDLPAPEAAPAGARRGHPNRMRRLLVMKTVGAFRC